MINRKGSKRKRGDVDAAVRCWERLVKLRWPEGARCPKCTETIEPRSQPPTLRCRKCHKQLSVTAGTIFHKSRVPLSHWFRAIELIASAPRGIAMRQLQRKLRLGSYRTAWVLAHKIRAVMAAQDIPAVLQGAEDGLRFITVDQMASGFAAPKGAVQPSQGFLPKYARSYWAEFAFRSRCKAIGRDPFDELLCACIRTPVRTLRDLTA